MSSIIVILLENCRQFQMNFPFCSIRLTAVAQTHHISERGGVDVDDTFIVCSLERSVRREALARHP